MVSTTHFLFSIATLLWIVWGQCLEPKYPFVAAPGISPRVLANGLTRPRGLTLDKHGTLLVVESGLGITRLVLDETCPATRTILIKDPSLNHGLALNAKGNLLYASSSNTAWSWSLDGNGFPDLSSKRAIVTNMTHPDHVTRTLLLPKKYPDLLIVSRGSNDNIDTRSIDPSVGRAVVKVFNLSSIPADGYDYASAGSLLGWGLRNDVGLVEAGDGGIWSVENSADDLQYTPKDTAAAIDIHENNPAEELNFLGDPARPAGRFYGYPQCYTVWDPSLFPGITRSVGSQFTLSPNDTFDDTTCSTRSTPARLSMQAHSAPLDIVITGANAFISYHGSWDRDTPTGYKVVRIPWQNSNGKGGDIGPLAPNTSRDAAIDVLTNLNEMQCQNRCFRPVGLAVTEAGNKMYVSSDATGEIFALDMNQAMFGDDIAGASSFSAIGSFLPAPSAAQSSIPAPQSTTSTTRLTSMSIPAQVTTVTSIATSVAASQASAHTASITKCLFLIFSSSSFFLLSARAF